MHPATKRLRDQVVEGDEHTNAEYAPSAFGGFREYFHNKQIKLQTQDKETFEVQSNILKGCVFYITGHTTPSAASLKRMIVENGGSVCAFLGGKSYATHIIAESLTSRKNELMATHTVVKPAWVVDSIKSGKLQATSAYRTVPIPKAYSSLANTLARGKLMNEADEVEFASKQAMVDPEQDEIIVTSPSRAIVLSPQHEEAGNSLAEHSDPAAGTNEPTTEAEQISIIVEQRKRVNCLAPDFLPLFYARSRLHLLSTYKSELRKRCKVDREQNGARITPQGSKRVIMHIDFDSFFASVALRSRPELKNRPVCVSHGGDSSDVASCNYVARSFGLRNGMWVGRAKTMCPDLICLPYEFEEYKSCSDKLYDILLGLGPDYLLPVSIDEAILEITSLVKPSEVDDFCSNIRTRVKAETGLDASIGVGPNILGAKMALRLAKPAGQRALVDEKATMDQISDLEVRSLPGVGYSALAKLTNLEVKHIRDLYRFSRSDLESRLGKSMGFKLFEMCRGIDSTSLEALDQPPKSLSVEVAWGIRFLNTEEIVHFIQNLCANLWDRKCDLKPDNVTLKIMEKEETAPFVPPKYMGSGWCSSESKSRRVFPGITLMQTCDTLEMMLSEFKFNPLMVRGVGISFKIHEQKEMVTTPTDGHRQTFLTRFTSVTPTSGGKSPGSRQMVTLKPRRRGDAVRTLTQFVADAPQHIDMEVFDSLPSQIKREILANEEQFDLPVPNSEIKVTRILDMEFFADHYRAVDLSGETNPVRIRAFIKEWIVSSPKPFLEDVEVIMQFLEDLFEKDWNWMLAISLLDWMERQIALVSSTEWQKVVQLARQLVEKSTAHL